MERNDWPAVATLMVLSILGAVAAGSAVLYGRSETLRNVRNVDERLIETLLRSSVSASSGEQLAKQIDDALGVMVNRTTGQPYVALTVLHDGVVVASNLDDGTEQTTSRTDEAGQTRELEKVPGDRDVDLGQGWTLQIHRYESRYVFDKWHSFLTVPLLQLTEGRDIYWDVVKRKASRPATVTLALGLILTVVYCLVLIRSRRRIRSLEHEIGDKEKALLRAVSHEEELADDLAAYHQQIEILDQKHVEAESVITRLRDEISTIADERDGEHALRLSKERQLEEALVIAGEIDVERANRQAGMQAAEVRLSEASKERDQLRQQLEETTASLEILSRTSARHAESKRATLHRLVRNIWSPLHWHEKAASDVGQALSEGAQRRYRHGLVDLLTRLRDGRPPNDGQQWEPIRTPDGNVQHNGGTAAAKLYWWKSDAGQIFVLHVCDVNAEKGATAQGNKLLRARLKAIGQN